MAWNFLSAAAIVANITFSIILVLLNKQLVIAYHFKFMTVLSGFHFISGFMVCLMFVLLGITKYKAVNSYWSVFRISLVRTNSEHVLKLDLERPSKYLNHREPFCRWFS